MKKRLIAIAVNLVFILTLIPAQLMASADTIIKFEDEQQTIIKFEDEPIVIKPFYPDFDNSLGYNDPSSEDGEAILKAMMGQLDSGNEPTNFSDDSLTPYGTQKGDAFTILEKAELFQYSSAAWDHRTANFYDNLADRSGVEGTGISSVTDEQLLGLYFAQSVAFDPTGCGRRNYVAVVGYRHDAEPDTGTAHLYIINADTKALVKHIELWSHDKKLRAVMNALTFVDSGNLFSITAGDYNNDGSDSLVIYSGGLTTGTNYIGLREVSYKNGNWSTSYVYEGSNGVYMNSDYVKSGLTNSYQLRNQLCASLATGDLNGDGIDDLAVLSGAADIHQDYYRQESIQNKPCIPQLCVGYGKTGAAGIAKLDIDRCSVSQSINGNLTTIACGDVAIGDIDGDGRNEIITAGYKNLTKTNDPYVVPDGPLIYAHYKTNGKGTLKRTGELRELASSKVSPIAKDDSLREGEILFQKLSVECAALNGKNTKEYVFLSGWFYYLNSNGELESVSCNTGEYNEYTNLPNPFKRLTTKLNSKDIDEVFIASVAVGNIFGSNNGNEAVSIIVGRKTHTNSNAEGQYNFIAYVYWNEGSNYGTNVSMRYHKLSHNVMHSLGFNINDADNSFINGNGFSVLLATVDIGDDSVVGRYSGKAYSYTDPTTVAFLQAAPYYSEFDPGNSSTQYSYSESYRVTDGSSTELSYNVGLSTETEAGPVKMSMDVGVAYELTEEFTSSLEKTFTTTFEANGENQVILRQTLMYYYFYDVQVKNNGKYEFIPGALVVSAPQYPVLTSLSMTQYNGLARAYNKQLDEASKNNLPVNTSHKMEEISEAQMEKYFLYNEGNPFAYASDCNAYSYAPNPKNPTSRVDGWDLSKVDVGNSDNWMRLSHAGGTQTQAYTVTLEQEKTSTVAEGGFVNMTVMAGGGIGSLSAYAGVTAEYERLDSSTYSTAAITGTETSGTVQNLDADSISYSFDWKLIGWKTDDLFVGVPFVGYAVKAQKAPPQPVTDLKATFSSANGGEVTLTWTAPNEAYGRTEIEWFYVKCDQKDSSITGRENSGAGNVHSATINVRDYSPRYATFTVTSYNDKTKEASMPSNEAYCLFAMSDTEVNELIKQTKTDLENNIKALKEALEEADKNNSTDIEALKNIVSQLDEAYKAADTLINSDLADLAEDLKSFKEAAEKAKKALEEAIKLVQDNLDKAVEDLNNAIEAGDKANAEAITKAIEELTADYKKADALMKTDIDTDITGLRTSMAAAQKALSEAIATVQLNLDNSNAEMKKALADLKAAYEAELKNLREELNTFNQNAVSENGSLRKELTELKEQIAVKDKQNAKEVQAMAEVNATQGDELNVARTIATVGLSVAGVSLIGNVLLAILELKKRKAQ